MVGRIIAAAVALAALSSVAMAESQRDRQEKACQGDAMKFCRDFVPDEEKIAACMGQHRSELSVLCGIVFDTGMKR